MTDLVQDTGARGERAQTEGPDAHHTGTGSAQAPGGGRAPSKTINDLTHGQEGYAGPREAGETDKTSADSQADFDATTNNAQTPTAGDVNPESTASSDETGQAGVNDRPGKDKAHPYNG